MSEEEVRETFYMPAEWSEHLCCLILYPHNRSTFRGDECEYARAEVRAVARTISTCEPVMIFCCDEITAARLRCMLEEENGGSDANRNEFPIDVKVLPSDDTWSRDTGPTFLVSKGSEGCDVGSPARPRLAGIDWGFNAYGGPEEGCYWPCEKDKLVASLMIEMASRHLRIPIRSYIRHDVVLEGGSIHVDGEGTILATEQSVLNPNRNPGMSKEQMESILLQMLGGRKMIWIPRGLYMDEDTDGHVDNMCCFVRPGHVALAWTDDTDDPQYPISAEALRILQRSQDANGRTLQITKLHNPQPLYYAKHEVESLVATDTAVERKEGVRLAASYVNFYIANDGVIVPGFGHEESDERAVATLSELFPERKVLQVLTREILLGGGNIHCITQQVPKPIG